MPTLALNLDPGGDDDKKPQLPPGVTMTRKVVSRDTPGPMASTRPLSGQRALEVVAVNQKAAQEQKK